MSQRLIPPERLPDFGVVLGNERRKELEAVGQFPRRVMVTERRHAYVEQELLDYAASRIAARDAKQKESTA